MSDCDKDFTSKLTKARQDAKHCKQRMESAQGKLEAAEKEVAEARANFSTSQDRDKESNDYLLMVQKLATVRQANRCQELAAANAARTVVEPMETTTDESEAEAKAQPEKKITG